MVSFYSVVQYVPDPATDERINIGLLTLGDGRVRTKFIQEWRRVKQFAGTNVSFLADVIGSMKKVSESDVRAFVVDWKNSVQLTELRASTLDPDALMAQLSPRLLRGLSAPRRAPHGHAHAVTVARRAIKGALSSVVGSRAAQDFIKEDEPVRGEHLEHRFDLAVRNGHLVNGVFAISFQVHEPALESQLRAKLYSLKDVRGRYPDLAITVAALPPDTPAAEREFGQAAEAIAADNAKLVVEQDLPAWAGEVAREFYAP